ncbi:hypothetical protein DRQ05_04840 [bacterium]|nr:MAG: hypothetical protein DRQ05_04840 [bacterium]
MSIERSDITFPNILTLLRMVLAVLALYLFFGFGLGALATLICLFASFLDFFDGWYARRYDKSTKLGVHLDPLADKVLVASMFVMLSYSLRWGWFVILVAIIFVREALITVLRARRRRQRGEYLPAGAMGKAKAFFQYVVGNSFLFYIFVYPAEELHQSLIVITLMIITTFLTVDSGFYYLFSSDGNRGEKSIIVRIARWLLAFRVKEV